MPDHADQPTLPEVDDADRVVGLIARLPHGSTVRRLALQVLQGSGIKAFIFKDDAGGMEPHLQLTGGVRLVVSREEAERAYQIIQTFDNSA